MIELIISGLARVGAVTVPVSGGSMLPTLRPGERVVLYPIEPQGIRPGDVVAYRFRGTKLVLHRVHAVGPDQLVTAGDNGHFFDRPVWRDDVIGVARDIGPACAPVPWAVAAQPATADIWLIGGDADRSTSDATAVPAGWRVRRRPADGDGVSAAVLKEIQGAVVGRPCIGVSEHAVRAADEVLPGGLPAHAQVIIGCSYGQFTSARPGLLLPGRLVDLHVRLGPPRVRLTAVEALHRLVALVASERVS